MTTYYTLYNNTVSFSAISDFKDKFIETINFELKSKRYSTNKRICERV